MNSVKNKLASKKGESLVETLAGMLVIVLAMTMLAGAIVSASKVNYKIDNQKTSFEMKSVKKASGCAVYLEGIDASGSLTKVNNVQVFQMNRSDQNGQAVEGNGKNQYYYYYEYQTEEKTQ